MIQQFPIQVVVAGFDVGWDDEHILAADVFVKLRTKMFAVIETVRHVRRPPYV